ncbi:hypothetical protein BU26DRAFT_512701 [Trematosphaeria pertusa]|uniref:DNA replication regulator Sld3 C-terminal domain-containing protein n=1 Tax=Trematosphaeria pertusa TaxID=390896 RepID=A0A6A6IZ58_9PLEO|nr:uncharacterized protein BU26DRAFT_512701 [Trematosphaeria pertusa]KAF2255739.1 hypothetical protein BU26DRAFT_512701 [Trematosphaeria pertusa]
MLQAVCKDPTEILGLSTKRDTQQKSQLPSKRKRDTICGLGTFTKPFTIKPYPESPYGKPTSLKPVRVIGRSQLPLTFLDTSADDGLVAKRLFSAYIDILEQYDISHNKENESPRVLIARSETKRALYVVELVQSRVYSLCKLAGWLKEKDVGELWDPESLRCYPMLPMSEHGGSLRGEWWRHTTVIAELDKVPVKRPRLSMVRPKPKPQLMIPQPIPQVVHDGEPTQEQPGPSIQHLVPEAMEIPSPQEQFDALVQHYLDAIYISKTSLAYLAKGPIARIRNTFTSPDEGAPPTYELVTFLRSMLLSHKAQEKKYQDKLPEMIKAIPPGCFSDEELGEGTTKQKKPKKKVKLGREGVYSFEQEIVKRWWMSEMPNAETHGEETIDQRIKRRVGDLRVREALAQMILMLEIIALEVLSTCKGPSEEEHNAVEESQTQGASQAKPKKRKKKLEDVKLLLDLLLDKLCIWQSVEQEGVLDFDAKVPKQDSGAGASGQRSGNDRLQGFCVEVVIPFYMSRLPEQARMINKKLGGPAHASPPKRKAMRPPATSRKSSDPKEPDTKKPRRALGRVATDTTGQTSQRRATPSLSRSATDSALIDGIKREGSEVPLSAIPFQRSPSAAARQAMSQFKHLKGREIDLVAPSAAAAAKMKQKKRVEEDLKEAITALKKPNRGLAAGSYADDIERRGLGLSNRSRKPANPVRKIVKDVQVSATPRVAKRTKDLVEQTPVHHRNPFFRPRETNAPPSSDFCIPSSAARPSSSTVPATVQRSVTARKIGGIGVAETPCRALSNKTFLTSGADRKAVFATPSKVREFSPDSPAQVLHDTPTKAVASSPPDNLPMIPPAVFATPSKGATAVHVTESPLPTFSNPTKDGGEASIYDALGWNDEDELL